MQYMFIEGFCTAIAITIAIGVAAGLIEFFRCCHRLMVMLMLMLLFCYSEIVLLLLLLLVLWPRLAATDHIFFNFFFIFLNIMMTMTVLRTKVSAMAAMNTV